MSDVSHSYSFLSSIYTRLKQNLLSFQENVITFATETTVVNGMKTIEFYDYTGSYHISTNPTTGDLYKKNVSGRRLKF